MPFYVCVCAGHLEQGRTPQQLLLLQPVGVLRGGRDHWLLNQTFRPGYPIPMNISTVIPGPRGLTFTKKMGQFSVFFVSVLKLIYVPVHNAQYFFNHLPICDICFFRMPPSPVL